MGFAEAAWPAGPLAAPLRLWGGFEEGLSPATLVAECIQQVRCTSFGLDWEVLQAV